MGVSPLTCPNPSDSFLSALEIGLPEKRLYGLKFNDFETEKIDSALDNIASLQYAPKGFEDLSVQLENPWVKIAITIALIALICWFFPGALTTVSSFILQPVSWLHQSIQKIFTLLPGINYLTTTGAPIVQLAAGVGTLVAGIFSLHKFATGAAVGCLSMVSTDLVIEKTCAFFFGLVFNPKRFSLENSNPVVADSYNSTILGMIFSATVTIPIIEELLFRGVIPWAYEIGVTGIGYIVTSITNDDCTKEVEWFIKKTNTIFCSVIFGALHFQNDHLLSFAQALYCGWSGVRIMHPLMEAGGLECSIAEHMMNNSIAVVPIVISHTLFG